MRKGGIYRALRNTIYFRKMLVDPSSTMLKSSVSQPSQMLRPSISSAVPSILPYLFECPSISIVSSHTLSVCLPPCRCAPLPIFVIFASQHIASRLTGITRWVPGLNGLTTPELNRKEACGGGWAEEDRLDRKLYRNMRASY